MTDHSSWTTTSLKEIDSVSRDYRQNIFLITSPSLLNIKNCTNKIDGRVTKDMNVELQKSFAKYEIKEALFQMAPLKSLDPNGFNASSYLRY